MKMKLGRGTPKSLTEAIGNGIDDFNTSNMTDRSELVEIIRENVEEFIRNKLSNITMASEDPAVLRGVEKIVKSLE